MSVNSGQKYITNQLHYLRKDITFADDGTTLSMGWLPAGAVVVGGGVVVSTLFNDTGTDYLQVGFRNAGDGTADDTDEFATNLDLSAEGFIALDEIDASVGDLYFPSGAEIVCSYAGANSDSTAGVAHVHVYYTVSNE